MATAVNPTAALLAILFTTGVAYAQDPPTRPVRPLPGGEEAIDPAAAALQAMQEGRMYGPPAPPAAAVPTVQEPLPPDFIGPPTPGQQQDPPVPGAVRPLPGEDQPLDPARVAERTLQEGEILYGPPPPPGGVQEPGGVVPVVPLPVPDVPVDPARAAGDALQGGIPGTQEIVGPLPAAPSALTAADAGYPVHGSLRVGYRYRHVANNDEDQDLQGSLSLDFGDPARHPVTGHLFASGWWDIDGFQNDNLLNGIQETYDRDYGGFVWDAYADLHVAEDLNVLRLGRQSLLDTPAILFMDGARVETIESSDWGVWAGGYAGVPVRFFRSYSSDDFTGGLFAGVRPWPGARMRFDYMHLEDATEVGDLRDDLFSADIWQNFDATTAHFKWSWLESESRDVLLQSRTNVLDSDLLLSATYFEQFITLGRLPTEIDPYFESAFFYEPYRQLNLLASKGFDDKFTLDAGFDIRRLSDASDEGQFNREFEHYFLTPIVHGADGGWSFALTGDFWRSDGDDVSTFTADLTVDLNEELQTSVGTGYSLFKFDTFTGRENDNVRDFYIRFDYLFAPGMDLDFTYSYEFDDLEDYHTLRIYTSWSF